MVNCPTTTERQFAVSPNVAIVDNDPDGVLTNIVISDQPGTVGILEVRLNISHTFIGDLVVSLSNGTDSIELLNRPVSSAFSISCSSNNLNVILRDGASSPINSGTCNVISANPAFPAGANLRPFQALSVFSGADVNGTWTLTVSDNAAGDIGIVNSWSLDFVIAR